MKKEDVIKLLEKEREYEKKIFGDYKELQFLNPASFLIMIQKYIGEMESAYQRPWKNRDEFPAWLKDCFEAKHANTAPTEFYENVIKLTALGMAILETYADLDVDKWRECPERDGQKWQIKKIDKGVLENE